MRTEGALFFEKSLNSMSSDEVVWKRGKTMMKFKGVVFGISIQ